MLSRAICVLISLVVVACAAATQTPERVLASAGTPKATPPIHSPDAAASYHFMLGYQAELAQDMDRAIQEYQAALRADPASQSVKARLAGLYFSLGDMPNAVLYADQAAEGPSQDSQLLTQMAGILASAGQGERAVKLLDRAIEINPTSGDPYFTKGLLLLNLKRQPEAEQAVRAGLGTITWGVSSSMRGKRRRRRRVWSGRLRSMPRLNQPILRSPRSMSRSRPRIERSLCYGSISRV
jgi:Flp pilus assembly protein TadD